MSIFLHVSLVCILYELRELCKFTQKFLCISILQKSPTVCPFPYSSKENVSNSQSVKLTKNQTYTQNNVYFTFCYSPTKKKPLIQNPNAPIPNWCLFTIVCILFKNTVNFLSVFWCCVMCCLSLCAKNSFKKICKKVDMEMKSIDLSTSYMLSKRSTI